ncbi:MAG: hypothetical protein QJT81_08525 [Candidatus Thiothrix putei]|uniref:CBM-cenC domain-containing protein n=1 Tax=Candidatus Thiothrix putei TaxID=3080811 RepID=A0AA95HF96_9GAMM|nr:MAG: hypothetical protein QJT81_08525 [Candidatus Thiothrix putei]
MRSGLVLLAALTLYLSISYRSAHIVPDDFIDTRRLTLDIDPHGWKPLDTDDWCQLAEQAQEKGELNLDEIYTLQALAANISSGRAIAKLAHIRLKQGNQAQAERLAHLATRIVTAQDETHLPLALFWGKIGKYPEIVKEWNILFTRDSLLHAGLFPHMRAIAGSPSTAHLIESFAMNPPSWWVSFFNYLATDQQTSPKLLEHLYTLRLRSPTPLYEGEMKQYINRLLNDKHWTNAYDVWLTSLPKDATAYKGLIYDGGFEGKWHNTGFDWFFVPHAQLNIKQDMTFGMDGHRALKIRFNPSKHIKFQHVWQNLLLKPANYELSLRFRTDHFRTNKGLQWRMRCSEDDRVIAESPVLQESNEWSTLTTPVEVPPVNCETQVLRLEAASSYTHDQVFKGDVWFDTIRIRPLSNDDN